MLKAMGSEVRTGKYYNKAGKVALHIKGKSNYHFDYSKGKKSGHAEHSKYGKMTSGLKHQSEFQKQAGKSKGKVVKIKAGTHSEKRRDKKGKVVTRHVSNKPKVKGAKQAAGSVVNKPKPKPMSTGAQEPVAKFPITDARLGEKLKYHSSKVAMHSDRLKELTKKTGKTDTAAHAAITKQMKFHDTAHDNLIAEAKKRKTK